MQSDSVEMLGLVAGFIGAFAFAPQAFKILRDRDAENVSALTYAMGSYWRAPVDELWRFARGAVHGVVECRCGGSCRARLASEASSEIAMIKSIAALCCAASLAACAPATEDVAAPAVQLYALDCGRVAVSDTGMFADDGSFDGIARDFVDPCYLIRHPSGDLLWDTGLPEALNAQPEGVTQGAFHINVPVTLTAQLAQLNLTPADIEFLSISHSHFDHLGNAALFTGATWIVDADERAHMFRDEARADENFAGYAALESFQHQLIEGDGDHDVFGDGSVTIIQAPGHTPGHAILRINLANAGVVLLAGDLYHMAESRERRTVPRFNTDRAQTLASMDKVEALAAETNARVIRQHVPEDFEALPSFPEALN